MKTLVGVLACLGFACMMPAQPASTQNQSSAGQSASTQAAANPISTGTKLVYMHMKNTIMQAAEQMSEADYSFRPVATVRTFGQLVGHVADAQYEFCSGVVGDGKKGPDVEKTKTTKADLIQSLKDAYAYCDQAYNGLTDAHAADLVKFMNRDMAKTTLLDINSAHMYEHYGNMVTYMRIKGLVPPSSQRRD